MIADTIMTPDLREIGRIDDVPNTHALAVSHDGKLLAAGDWSGNPSRIRIYSIRTSRNPLGEEQVQFELIRECCVGTTMDFLQEQLMEWGILSGQIQREGMWALDFSPDDSTIAVGTRNGNLMLWQIDCDPAKIVFDKRFPETGTDRLHYSHDGQQIVVNYREPAALRVFRVEDQSDRVKLLGNVTDFDLLSDGRTLTAGGTLVSRLPLDSFEAPVEFRQPGTLGSICTDRSRSLAVAGTFPVRLVDALTGESTLVLQNSDGGQDRPRQLVFSADTMMTVAAMPPQDLILWDSISGRQAIKISFPGNETPIVCGGREHDRIYVYSTVSTFAYQLRCSQAWQADVTPVTSLAHATPPVTALVPGAQSVTSFALSPDQQHMAMLEAGSLADRSTIPDGYRARLRKLESGTGRELQRWTCLLVSSGEDRNILTQGDALAFVEGDSRIAFTTPAVGNIAIASEAGFEFPSGVGIDVQQSAPDVTSGDAVSWTGGEVGQVSSTNGFRPAIALKLPRGLKQSGERLSLRLITGDTARQLDLADHHLDGAGWYLLCLDQFANAVDSGTWRIEAKLVDSDLRFRTDLGNVVSDDKSTIQVGNLFLLPWKRLSRGKTPPVYPLRLGPLVQRHDGGLAAVVESWTLYQWLPGELSAHNVYWRDVENSEEDIRGLSPGVEGCFAGTDSGVAAVVSVDGSTLGLDQERTTDGSYDSRDGVTATATADAGKLAAMGTLQGQIKIYKPKPVMTAPAIVTDAHSREIVALSLAENGHILASASADGELKFWKVHHDRLELWFELTSISTPVVKLQFSRDGQSLYVLREGERGVRRIDLNRLKDLFGFVQLP